MRFLTKTAKALQEDFPDIHFHIISGDGISVLENLDRGLIDFGLIFGEVDTSKYNMLKVPYKDTWGVLMRHDADLAEKEVITSEDLAGQAADPVPSAVKQIFFDQMAWEKVRGSKHCRNIQSSV